MQPSEMHGAEKVNRKHEINQAQKSVKNPCKQVPFIFVVGMKFSKFFMYVFFKDVIKTINNFLQLIENCQNTTPIKWFLLQEFVKLE